MGPSGGHGYSANSELGANRFCISVTFDDNVDDFPANNDIRRLGILQDPLFADVTVNFSDKEGSFLADEIVYHVNPVRSFVTNANINTTSAVITANVASFDTDFFAGDFIYLADSATSRQLGTVASVANSTYMTLTALGAFACNDTKIYFANAVSPSTVVTDGVDLVEVTNLGSAYFSGDILIGKTSGAYGTVDNMTVAGQPTSLSTFNQMWKYEVTTSDTFTPDEYVFQDDITLNHGRLWGLVGNSNPKTMYLSEQRGIVDVGGKLFGNTSGSSADVTDKFEPDLVFNSGRLLYLENLEAVDKIVGQKMTFKLIFAH
jgi:hypothetical protein